MAEILDFETTLFQALEEKTAWMDTSVLPSMLEDYRVEHSCVMNLINVLIQKGLIAPDPYKLDKKISDVMLPDEEPFSEADRNLAIGIRLSDYERIIDFLCNYFKFSVQMLTLERIKKLIALNNCFQWSSMTPTNPQPNTQGLAEILALARQGTDTLSISVINGSLSSISKTIITINSQLKQVTDLQRELYKSEIRKKILHAPDFPPDKLHDSPAAGIAQVKKLFPQYFGKQPFYSELIEEIFLENSETEGLQRQKVLLEKLKITPQKTEKKVQQVDTKSMIMDAVRNLSALAPLLTVVIDKLNENNSIVQSEHQGFGEKFMKLLRKAFGLREKPVEYTLPITDIITQTVKNEKINFQKTITDLTRRSTFYNSFSTRNSPGYQKIQSDQETVIYSFLTKQLSECQQMLTLLTAYDKFFKTAVQAGNRLRIKGLSIELTSIKNTLVKTNQRKAEYAAYIEEQQQLKKLGITDVV